MTRSRYRKKRKDEQEPDCKFEHKHGDEYEEEDDE
jgi:hypothetical protein